MAPKYQHVVLNTSRWESATIKEWVEYYIYVGFDHAYIYCNDDDPTQMYTVLQAYIEGPEPFITFHHMPFQGQQPACWMHFLDAYKDECEWFMFIDADEFLAMKPDNDVKSFMKERAELYDCIHFNWIWFGPEHYIDRPDGSTLLQYTHREDQSKQMNFFTKTLTRSSVVDSKLIGRPPIDMLNHRWPPTLSARMREVNVLGEDMTEFFSDFPKSAERFMESSGRRQAILDTACLYHYLFRSLSDFERRVKRGTLGAYYFQPMWGELAGKPEELKDFVARLNDTEDRYLADLWTTRNELVSKRAWATSLVPRNSRRNLALSSSPTQSSLSPWSRGSTKEDDARGAISGTHSGGDGFHTDCEEAPWWMTDLGTLHEVSEIRVYNSVKSPAFAARAYSLSINTSEDGITWSRLFDNHGASPFGGADGHPLIVRCDRRARFVKLSLAGREFFHLDEVEIFGV